MNNELRGLLNAIEGDIEEELISFYSCPYCGEVYCDDSNYHSPHQFQIGGLKEVKEHIVEKHLEDLKSDYGNGEEE